jgi:hypothetical protein
MPIPENQLDTWAKQGSITQSQATYKTVRGVLEGSDAAYAKRDYAIFLQGSYGNDTNIYADSDVDVVIRMDDIHYTDLDALSNEDKAAYQAARTTAEYSYKVFKSEVIAQLTMACCRFGGHRDKVFSPIGEQECREGSSAASSSLRR